MASEDDLEAESQTEAGNAYRHLEAADDQKSAAVRLKAKQILEEDSFNKN